MCAAPHAHTFCEWTADGNIESTCVCDKEQLFCSIDDDAPAKNTCKDNPVAPPDGYTWKRSCEKTCSENNDCPQNTNGSVKLETSNWCFESTCMMLIIGSSSKSSPESGSGKKKSTGLPDASKEGEKTEEELSLKTGDIEEKIFDQARDSSALKLSVDTMCTGGKPAVRVSYIKEADKTYTVFFDPSLGITNLPDDTAIPLVLYDGAYDQSEIVVKLNTTYALFVRTDSNEASEILSVKTPATCSKTVAAKRDPLPPLADPEPIGEGFCAQPINATEAIPYALQVSWKPVSGAIGYAVRIDQDPDTWGGDSVNEGDTVDNEKLKGENATSLSRIAEYEKTYTWWVHSINADGVYSSDPPHQTFTCPQKPNNDEVSEESGVGAGQLIKL